MTTPLHSATRTGDLAEVKRLLQTPGIDLNAASNGLSTPLYIAAASNRIDIAQELLDAGADTESNPGAQAYTPFQVAALLGKKEMMRFLSERGANVNAKSDSRSTLTLIASTGERSEGVASLLIELGADTSKKELTIALFRAAENGHASIIQALAAAGADVNAREEGGNLNFGRLARATPLHAAVMTRQIRAVRALLEAGADVRARFLDTRHGLTPLKLAAKHVNPLPFHIIAALVAAGDREWKFVPAPCPYLERALSSVWRQAPQDLPKLFNRLENPVKKVVRESLKVLQLHGRLPKELRMMVLGAVFDQVPASQADENEEEKVQHVSSIKRRWRVFKLVLKKMTLEDYIMLCGEFAVMVAIVMHSSYNTFFGFIMPALSVLTFLFVVSILCVRVLNRVGRQMISSDWQGLTGAH